MKDAIGLAFDYARKRVFYSDIQRGAINSVAFDGTAHRKVFSSPIPHLNLHFTVAIWRNCRTLKKMSHFFLIAISTCSFEVFKKCFKWEMTVLVI